MNQMYTASFLYFILSFKWTLTQDLRCCRLRKNIYSKSYFVTVNGQRYYCRICFCILYIYVINLLVQWYCRGSWSANNCCRRGLNSRPLEYEKIVLTSRPERCTVSHKSGSHRGTSTLHGSRYIHNSPQIL